MMINEGFQQITSLNNNLREQNSSVVLINLEALKSDEKATCIGGCSPGPSHPQVPAINVWGAESGMFAIKNKESHETKRLLTTSPPTRSNSEYENNILSDDGGNNEVLKMNLIQKSKDRTDLRCLEDEKTHSFAKSLLVVSTYDQSIETLDGLPNSSDVGVKQNKNDCRNIIELQSINTKNIDQHRDRGIEATQNNGQELAPMVEFNNQSESSFIRNSVKSNRSSRSSQRSGSASSVQSEACGAIELNNYAEDPEIPGTPHRRLSLRSSISNNTEHEDDRLLSEKLPHAYLSVPHALEDNVSQTSSQGSEFQGSLGINIDGGQWLSNLDVDLDIQLGRDEWTSSFQDPDSDTTLGSWDCALSEIAIGNADPSDWETKLQNLSALNHELDRQSWKSSIPQNLEYLETQKDWSTEFLPIEKVNPASNKWSTMIKKIKSHISPKSEWTTAFHAIERNTRGKGEWTFKLPDRLTHHGKKDDWKTEINKLGEVTSSTDPWQYRSKELLVNNDDRVKNWSTWFQDIEKLNLDLKQWQTIMNKIAPVGMADTWAFKFAQMSNDLGSPEDWRMKFLSINNLNEVKNWSVLMNDVPDSYREVADWKTIFKAIQETNPGDNPWNSTFNDIIPNGDDSDLWTSEMNQADVTDLSRETWQTSFNNIMPIVESDEWTVTVNPIEGTADS